MSLNGLNTNYAVQNKWMGYLPLSMLSTNQDEHHKFSDVELYLTDFTVPQIEIGSAAVSYKGYQIEVPNRVMNASTKEVTFDYIVDSRWLNYRLLYYWASGLGIASQVDKSANSDGLLNSLVLIPIRVYLLDPYKKKIIQFVYNNCWICRFGDMSMSYQENPDEIHHSFTVKYSDVEIEEV